MSEADPISPKAKGRLREKIMRIRGRADSEHEMSFNRVALMGANLTYISIASATVPHGMNALVAYTIVSILCFGHILYDPAPRAWRRLLMMVVDISGLSYLMAVNGVNAAGFWPLYLWVIFGNGFRFGGRYLFATAAFSILAFGLVIATTEFWWQYKGLSAGLMIGLIILPAYSGQLIRKISKARAEAEEASRAKSYFLASVSHELRTPLTAIIGLGEHLANSDMPAEQRGTAGTIVTAGRSLLTLINQLLDFARFGANQAAAQSKPFDLPGLLVSVRELLRLNAEKKGLAIRVHISSRTPLHLMGDEGHLRDILVNLIGNAIKFTDRGSVTISADARPSSKGPMMLRLAVTDTGIGIDSKAQEHIFESFRQADGTIIDRFGGTGLGLAICKQLVALLGGSIGVESAPGRGSSFWFTAKVENALAEDSRTETGGRFILLSGNDETATGLAGALAPAGIALVRATDLDEAKALLAEEADCSAILIDDALLKDALTPTEVKEKLGPDSAPILLAEGFDLERTALERVFASIITRAIDPVAARRVLTIAKAAAGGPTAAVPERPVLAQREPRRILVADDNEMNLKVFGMILGRAGHSVDTAGDGESALDILRNEQHDIVLMDVNMPTLNGIEATKLYRFVSLGRRRVPIVGVTADASPETAQRCIDAGMDACVSKPVEAAALLDLIDDLCGPMEAPSVKRFDPGGVVTPLFPEREEETPAVNWAKLDDLEDLGGADFVAELLDVYVADSSALLDRIKAAVAAHDITEFRDGTHALRSTGANVGAEKLAEMCRHLQRIDAAEFDEKSAFHEAALEAELERVQRALANHGPERPAALG